MNKYKYIITFLLFNTTLISQENADIAEIEVPSKLEQLIIDIESEIDIEKRFDFSRSNSKEK